jgi:SAM-dependent methyltransferase
MALRCRLCGSADLKLFYLEGDRNQFRYYRCVSCSLVNYDMEGGVDQEKFVQDFVDPFDLTHKINIGQMRTYAFIKKLSLKKGAMLDIGCYNGGLLAAAQLDGWEVQGLELFEALAAATKQTTGIEVIVAEFPDCALLKGTQYDVIVLRHVLEHLPDPVTAMNTINGLLNPGGSAIMEFPNIMSINLRWKYLLRRNGLLHSHFPPEYKPHHCNEFCFRSFSRLCRQTGFQLVNWETYSSKNRLTPLYRILRFGTKARVHIRKGCAV